MITVYISIGNSDDKLSQAEWSHFHRQTNDALRRHVQVIHGEWASGPVDPWQNACWCVEIQPSEVDALKTALRELAAGWEQDSIAWAVGQTEFLQPARGGASTDS